MTIETVFQSAKRDDQDGCITSTMVQNEIISHETKTQPINWNGENSDKKAIFNELADPPIKTTHDHGLIGDCGVVSLSSNRLETAGNPQRSEHLVKEDSGCKAQGTTQQEEMDVERFPTQNSNLQVHPEPNAPLQDQISSHQINHQKNISEEKIQNGTFDNGQTPQKDAQIKAHNASNQMYKIEEEKLIVPDLFPLGLELRGAGTLSQPIPIPPREFTTETHESMLLFYRWLTELENPNINAEHIFGRLE